MQDVPQPALEIDPPDVAAAQAIRFCRTCGSEWNPQWLECATCSTAKARSIEVEAIYSQERGAVRSAVWLYFSLLAISIVVMVQTLVTGQDLSVTGEFVVSIAMSAMTIAWCIAARQTLWPLLKIIPSIKWFVLAAALAVCTFIVATAAVNGLERMGMDHYRYSDTFTAEGFGWGWVILVIAVQPGIFEELGFRGVILSALLRVVGKYEAVFVSALMFAILHLSIPSIPHLFLIGTFLAWLRLKTGSMYPGMLLHFTHNLLVVLAEKHEGLLPWS